MNTAHYLAAFKSARDISSDYGVAKALGVSPQAVSRWVHGQDTPAPLQALQIALALGLDPGRVIADMEHERAQRGGRLAAAATWRAWLDKLGSAAAACVAAVILSAGLTPGNANAGAELAPGAGVDGNHHRRGNRRKRSRRRSAARQAFDTLADSLTSGHAVAAR